MQFSEAKILLEMRCLFVEAVWKKKESAGHVDVYVSEHEHTSTVHLKDCSMFLESSWWFVILAPKML